MNQRVIGSRATVILISFFYGTGRRLELLSDLSRLTGTIRAVIALIVDAGVWLLA